MGHAPLWYVDPTSYFDPFAPPMNPNRGAPILQPLYHLTANQGPLSFNTRPMGGLVPPMGLAVDPKYGNPNEYMVPPIDYNWHYPPPLTPLHDCIDEITRALEALRRGEEAL